jgi:hypothetical protein
MVRLSEQLNEALSQFRVNAGGPREVAAQPSATAAAAAVNR